MKNVSSKKLCTVCSISISALVILYYVTVRAIAALSNTLDIQYNPSGLWWTILIILPIAHGIFTAGSESHVANIVSLLTIIPYITASKINRYLAPAILIYWIVVYALHADRSQKVTTAEDNENEDDKPKRKKSQTHVIVKVVCIVLTVAFTLFLCSTLILEKVILPDSSLTVITDTDYPSPDGKTKVNLYTEHFNDLSAPEGYRDKYTTMVTTERTPLFNAGPVIFCREAIVLYEEEANTLPDVSISWADNDTAVINGEEFDLH